ncbi:MFS transporter [Nocardioides sp. GY 10127]|uniref:MFS transporter n=1 Tax=Nocardioides sp. GY 10127 TaxID=2569762 RepID=UPI0010A81A4E|nr:MFS transporter [Nocardioides sp. GY 10127]TIC81610.1 MFS transporter [Nocardioides sp. GY 10127]
MTATPDLLAEPTTRVGRRWLTTFALAWLGVWLAQLTPIQLLLPLQVDDVLGTDATSATGWVDSVVAYGVISGIAGVFALAAYPLAGTASDRTRSRFGRRRPWIAVGSLVFAAGLLGLSAAHDVVTVGVGWVVALVGFCIVTAVLTAAISDQVPVDQRGLASGLVSAPQALGIIVGLAVVTVAGWGQLGGYVFSAVALLVLVLPFLVSLPDPPSTGHERPAFSWREVVTALWVDPREHPDFGWVLAGRLLVNLGNAIATTLLLYYLEYGLRRPHAEDDLLLLSVVYMLFVIVASVWLGRASDRTGRRRPFVVVAALLQAVAGVLLVVAPTFPAAVVGGALLGAGYGSFLSVDQALATQVLPDPATRGKDLGIMNVATAGPQAFGPLVGAGLVVAFGGFSGLFLVSALTALLGGATTLFVRSVR